MEKPLYFKNPKIINLLPPAEYEWKHYAGFSGYVCRNLAYKRWFLIKMLYPEFEGRTYEWWGRR